MIAPMARIATLITASAAAMALLAGCTAGPLDLDIAVDRGVAAPSEPTAPAEPVEASTDGVVAGDTLTKEQAIVMRSEDDGNGLKSYTFSDGSIIAVDRLAPMPETVKAEVTGNITSTRDADGPGSGYFNLLDEVAVQQAEAGKKLVVVMAMTTKCEAFGPELAVWRVGTSKTFVQTCYGTREAAIAAAQKIVAAQDEPARWEIVVG
jgi:hypothetical protein